MACERRRVAMGRIGMGWVTGAVDSESRDMAAESGVDGRAGVSPSARPFPPAFYAGGAPEPGAACGGMGGGGMGVCLGGPVAAGGIGGGGIGVVRTGWG